MNHGAPPSSANNMYGFPRQPQMNPCWQQRLSLPPMEASSIFYYTAYLPTYTTEPTSYVTNKSWPLPSYLSHHHSSSSSAGHPELTSPQLQQQPNPQLQMAPPANNPSDMMDILNSPMYSSFDVSMPMHLDLDLDMQQSLPSAFPPVSGGSNHQQQQQPQSQMSLQQHQHAPMGQQADMDDSSAAGSTNGFGNSSAQTGAQAGSSTLTEFTKRRNWPAKVVEELKDFLQILDAHGRIKYVSPSVSALTGYQAEEVVEGFLRDLIHPDDVGTFTSEMNEAIATGNPMRMFYRLKKKDGQFAIFESVGHAHIASAKFAPNPDNQTPFCQAIFVMSRPYPTRNASLLDSFLEHKVENERLRRRIAELRREEEEEEASQKSWLAAQDASDMTPSEDMQSSVSTAFFNSGAAADSAAMPPPEKPSHASMSLTRENLEGATAGSRSDSIKDKMARFEGASHTDTIEMLTGLRYVEGERSRGITTGNHSPTLIRGDAGIAIPIDRDPRTGEKKKKLKVAEEYVCTDCGTLDSPEWRKGPSGPKTLCNACGLRWAKKEKKKSNTGGKETPAAAGAE